MSHTYDYEILHMFNSEYYKNLLTVPHICGDEIFIKEAIDIENEGNKFAVHNSFYPLKKDRKTYLLPANKLNLLPIIPTITQKISVKDKVYYVVVDERLAGFGAEQTFDSFKDFIDQFCNFEHSNKLDFTIWKIIAILAYVRRINVRVASEPAFGKDSIMKVMSYLFGDVGIVHNPTIAKLEWLLGSKIVMTNEVAGIKADDRDNLSQCYLTCGDFSISYTKRSRATLSGVKDVMDISKLSNVVCYNNKDCYPKRQQNNYFDNMFQRAIHQRFLPLKMDGKITEQFHVSLDKRSGLDMATPTLKKSIKMVKFLEKNIEQMGFTEYSNNVVHDFSDRLLKNWDTITRIGFKAYAHSQKEYDELCTRLFEMYNNYKEMVAEPKPAFIVDKTPEPISWEEKVKHVKLLGADSKYAEEVRGQDKKEDDLSGWMK